MSDIDSELAMVAEDRRTRAAADLEVQRKSAWTATVIKESLAAGVDPREVYKPAFLESQLAAHTSADDYPPGVSAADFAAYADLNDISPINYLGEEVPPMLREFRKLQDQRAKMANIAKE
jgi:hypothetical protein